MKLEELLENFRTIVKEEVTKAVQAELRDILVEAVDIASNPNVQEELKQPDTERLPLSTFRQPYLDIVEEESEAPKDKLLSVIRETQQSMRQGGFDKTLNFTSADVLRSAPGIKVDSSGLPDFAMKAKKILDASIAIDKSKHGV